MDMEGFFYRDTWAEIDLGNIEQNITSIKKLFPEEVKVIAVVKANAYGHGGVEVAETALAAGAEYLAVAFLDEALALRKKGIEAPMLILGATRPEDVKVAAENSLTVTAYSLEWLQEASAHLAEHSLSIHIKVDTGMGRIGFKDAKELKQADELIKADGRFLLEGVFTHFATADETGTDYFRKQLREFNHLLGVFSHRPSLVHASNSAAAIRFPEARFNAVRLGIGMYGLAPSPEMKSELPVVLHEAFSLHSRIVQIKKLQKGEYISYGATYQATGEEWIATIPIGYADGWIRKLQGQEVLVNEKRSPIVGRICMDQCMIRLQEYAPPGTEVILIGRQGAEFVGIDEIARNIGTINYEIPCLISNRVPRLYKKEGEMVGLQNNLLAD
ncbi:alanine racemase [Bacillus sp. FJAT-27445]|uniref:alanine racemase n=1 Tax=Bacillus sp. FJAT-27445 TaxID=1679166 RepID=UPI0007444AED|nr:alanine racemase [Bacillus sp. FJAT-27445]